jgi:hypothetical protein
VSTVNAKTQAKASLVSIPNAVYAQEMQMLKIYREKRNEAILLLSCVILGGLWCCGDQGEDGRERPFLA